MVSEVIKTVEVDNLHLIDFLESPNYRVNLPQETAQVTRDVRSTHGRCHKSRSPIARASPLGHVGSVCPVPLNPPRDHHILLLAMADITHRRSHNGKIGFPTVASLHPCSDSRYSRRDRSSRSLSVSEGMVAGVHIAIRSFLVQRDRRSLSG